MMLKKQEIVVFVLLLIMLACGCSSAPEATPTPAAAMTPTSMPTEALAATATPSPQPSAAPTINAAYLYDGVYVPPDTSPLTGLPMETYLPVAVIIENTKAAYPQYGLSEADVVYELTVEGKITRFIAIFNDNHPEKVGPVRSIRVQMLRALAEYQTILTAHFGGAGSNGGDRGNAYARFTEFGMTLREDFILDGKPYWRTSDRTAPHNAYTSLPGLLEENPGYTAGDYRPFPFGTQAPEGDSAVQINLTYRATNQIEYRYDTQTQSYARYLNGDPMIDAGVNEQIYVTNIIVPVCTHVDLHTADKHIDIEYVGSGPCDIFVGGRHIEGQWIKRDDMSRTRYVDADGNEVMLLPGNTWVQVRATIDTMAYQ